MGSVASQQETVSPQQITAVILAGGRARRMQGIDKGLVTLDGRPLIEHVIERIRPQVGQLVINANRHLDEYADYGFAVIPDRDGDFRGPLAGMAAAMDAIDTPYLLTVPCDSPVLPLDLASRLAAAMDAETAICFATSPEREQPVYALLRRNLLESLEQYLAEGNSKIDLWYARHPSRRVAFEDEAQFANINSPQDMASLSRPVANAGC